MGERARSRNFEAWAGERPSWTTAGMLAAAAWLSQRSLSPPLVTSWHALVALGVTGEVPAADADDRVETRFHVEIFAQEWGFFFCHGGRASWIRVTDIPFVHGRDDHRLLPVTPPLKEIGGLMRRLEQRHGLRFRRDLALVRTNLAGAEPAIRKWVDAL
jgi:hypothetical protein